MNRALPPGAYPGFRPRLPWWGPDLQTLRNLLRAPRPSAAPAERHVARLPDGSGDRMLGLLQVPGGAVPERPLAVLVHGLSGSEDSAYMHASAAALLARGHPVLRSNLRGAGPSRAFCRFQYHAGRTQDLDALLASLPEDRLANGLVLMGFSLGANLLLKFLAEYGGRHPIRAAAAVSAPIDLAAASRRFLAPRNRFYQRHMLRSIQREALAPGAELDAAERLAVAAAGSIWEFDEHFVAPRNGFAGAEHYYAENSALRFLPSIRVPTLVIHALDDPWIPGEAYQRFAWRENPALQPLLPSAGGHVGFHGRGSRWPWHDLCFAAFLEAHAADPARAHGPDA